MNYFRVLSLCFFVVSLPLCSSCSKAYFGALERLGYPKRDLMISRVQSAQKSQQAAKEEFKDALERYKAVLTSKGGKLGDKYNQLKSQLSSCETRAKDVSERIASVEEVSNALLREWEQELGQYSNKQFEVASRRQLNDAKDRASLLIATMKRAESRLRPALQPLRDNVLFLKHNLNARAITGLNDERIQIEDQVSTLIRDLERSIDEADRFITDMNREERA